MKPFIYALSDPLRSDHVRYVGMSFRADRPLDHAKNAREGSTFNPHLMNWVRKLQAEGREYVVSIIEELPEGSVRSFVGFVERCYIRSLREIGHRLTNIADGGDGGNTNAHTPDVRAKISARTKGRIVSFDVRARTSASLMGHPVADTTRRRQSEAKLRYYQDPENRRKRSESAKAAATEEVRKKIGEAGRGRIVSAETRAKISATLSRVKLEVSAKRREEQGLD